MEHHYKSQSETSDGLATLLENSDNFDLWRGLKLEIMIK